MFVIWNVRSRWAPILQSGGPGLPLAPALL